MINLGLCYAVTWLLVFTLYELDWSSLNVPLSPSMIVFFIITILIGLLLGLWRRQEKPNGIVWKKRSPLITIALVGGFCLDWLYRGGLPLLQEYAGFNPESSSQPVVGIPMVHVALIGTILVAIPYLYYLYESSGDKKILFELLALLLVLFLNKSRGYIVFVVICMVLIYLRLRYTELRQIKMGLVLFLVGLLIALFLFISIAGNVRSGYAWYDCSYIRKIGKFDAYPSWLTEHFMWGYTYITSCLGNLAYNIQSGNITYNISELLFSFLPESLSAGKLATPVYVVLYLNACTGYISAACAYGILGLYLYFFIQMLYYHLLQFFFCKQSFLATFTEPMLCFLVIVTLFYSPFTSSAVCYMPLLLICLAFYLEFESKRGKLELVQLNNLSKYPGRQKRGGTHFARRNPMASIRNIRKNGGK